MSDAIDVDELMERVQDDKELLLELLDIFLEDFEAKRGLLKEAFEGSNFEELKAIGHSLKGASGNISAKALREIFVQIEESGEKKDVGNADYLLETMDKNFEDLKVHVEKLKVELAA